MAGVFISYRRVDSSPWALRIADHLVAALGADEVFIDVDALSPGEDFAVVIDETLRRCEVVLVLIGPRWLTVKSTGGSRRLDDPSDLVRTEVATALERDAGVIPVLLEDADLPSAADLPLPLRALANELPSPVSARQFDSDVAALLARIHRVLGRPRRPAIEVARAVLGGRIALGAMVVAVLGLLAFVANKPDAGEERPPDAVATLAIPDGPTELALVDGQLWLASRDHEELVKINPATAKVIARMAVPGEPRAIAIVGGSILVRRDDRTVVRIDASSGDVLGRVDIDLPVTAMGAGAAGVWLGLVDEGEATRDGYGSIVRVDVETGRVGEPIPLSSPPVAVAVAGELLWVIRNDRTVARVDPADGSVFVAGPKLVVNGASEPVPWGPVALAVGDGAIWVADDRSNEVVRLDPRSGEPVATIDVQGPRELVVGAGAVWVLGEDGLVRIDPARNQAAEPIEGLRILQALAVDDDALWVASRSPGVLRRLDPDSL